MTDDITYESICEKLGFDVDTYDPPLSDTEDDSMVSPFRNLSLEELKNFSLPKKGFPYP